MIVKATGTKIVADASGATITHDGTTLVFRPGLGCDAADVAPAALDRTFDAARRWSIDTFETMTFAQAAAAALSE